jgi:hypothetical protein
MNRLLLFIGLSGITYYFAQDALQSGLTFFGHVLPVLALALLAVFQKPINARFAAMADKLNGIADKVDAE